VIDEVDQVVGGAEASDAPDRSDPRKLVFAGIVLAAAVVVALTAVLSAMAARSRDSIRELQTSIDAPLGWLDETLAAGSEGEAHLQLAAATTGADRSRHLEAAITAGEATSKAWTRYQAVALRLDGEPALAARYRRDHALGKETAADAIVPILASDQPMPLPPEQIEAAMREDADLRGLRALYAQEQDRTLVRMQHRAERADRQIRIGAVGCLVLIAGFGLIALRSAHRTAQIRRSRSSAAELQAFESALVRGLELIDDDDQAWAAAARALALAAPTATIALSAADLTGTSMRTTAGTMACGITHPDGCPAVKSSTPLHFADSSALNACPRLAGAPRCSATCLPISVAGRSAGVAQLVGDVGQPLTTGRAVHVVVRRVGERITMMRAIARIERQAARDPLTGLINRRTLDREVADLEAAGSAYAVAFADLDHFKRLNDVHGHQAGDDALRSFASTLTDGLRKVDVACRWGGEEFVVVLPGCNEAQAVEAMERVRTLQLLGARSSDAGPPVTMSVGVAVHRAGEGFAETLVRADGALASAKATGRDRILAWTPPPASSASPLARLRPDRRDRLVGIDRTFDAVEPA
jgi:diguanylate cyclase (GGDEF)-like protein